MVDEHADFLKQQGFETTMGTTGHRRRLQRLEAAKGINTRGLVVIDVGTFEEGEVDDEAIERMWRSELELRLAELNVSEGECEVVFLVTTIVDPPDRDPI